MFMTLDAASKLYDIPKKYLLNLYYADRDSGRDDRFVLIDGVVMVHEDYLCPHKSEMEALYFQALETTGGNEKAIAKTIAKKTGKDINTVYMYLRNFKFKNYAFAHTVMHILKEFIQTHNLFYAGGIA